MAHRHDRCTGADLLAQLGVDPYVALHNAIFVFYVKSRYREQMMIAMQNLADKLDQVDGANVIRFPGKAGV